MLRIKAQRDGIAKVSYPGRSPETTDFTILAVVDQVWIITSPRAMEITESQVHLSLSWTPSGWHIEWLI